jgi:hypothetical protein
MLSTLDEREKRFALVAADEPASTCSNQLVEEILARRMVEVYE